MTGSLHRLKPGVCRRGGGGVGVEERVEGGGSDQEQGRLQYMTVRGREMDGCAS